MVLDDAASSALRWHSRPKRWLPTFPTRYQFARQTVPSRDQQEETNGNMGKGTTTRQPVDISSPIRPPTGSWFLLLRRACGAALVLAWISVFAAACNGDSPAQSSQNSSSSESTYQQAVDFSQCMRAHGVPGFPDPDSQGQFVFTQGSGVDPNSSQFQSARAACQNLLPAGSAGQQSQGQSQTVKFSQCMRAHGVPNFPDPQTQGGGSFFSGNGLDPNSPQFQSAMRACRSLLPSGAISGGS